MHVYGACGATDGTINAVLNATDFPADTPNDWFWASARAQDPETAWVVYFFDGYLEYTSRDNLYSVRCVAAN